MKDLNSMCAVALLAIAMLLGGCKGTGSGGPTVTQTPGDPFSNPELAPTTSDPATTNGARFGCSRKDNLGNGVWHGGIDLKASVGTSFVSIYSGKVTKTRADVSNEEATSGVGNFVIVRTADPNVSIKYCHLSEVSVNEGDKVEAGQTLGKTGRSGNAFNVPNPHLHVEVSLDHFLTAGKYTDPEPHLKTKYTPTNPNPATCP